MTTAVQPENPFAGQGAVLLDIGGDVGALVVTMPAAMEGVEVEIRPAGSGHDHRAHAHAHGHGQRPHVAVVSRPVAGGTLPSLVYPDLVEDTYELLVMGTRAVCLTARVTGGQVATAAWPT